MGFRFFRNMYRGAARLSFLRVPPFPFVRSKLNGSARIRARLRTSSPTWRNSARRSSFSPVPSFTRMVSPQSLDDVRHIAYRFCSVLVRSIYGLLEFRFSANRVTCTYKILAIPRISRITSCISPWIIIVLSEIMCGGWRP